MLQKLTESSKSFYRTGMDISFAKDAEITAIEDTIDHLTEKQRAFSKAYQFTEAAETKEKIKELKKDVLVRKAKEMQDRHQEKGVTLLQGQSEELQRFNNFWDTKMNNYMREVEEVWRQTETRNQEDLKNLEIQLNESLPVRPVKTIEHLSCISLVESLARNQRYTEAEVEMKKSEEFGKLELAKAFIDKEKKIKMLLGQHMNKQKAEMNTLEKKIISGKEKMDKMRNKELEKLHHKFRNMNQQMTMSQQLELSKFELSHKNYVPEERISVSPKKRGATAVYPPQESSFFTTSRTVMHLEKSLSIDKSPKHANKVSHSASHQSLKRIVNPRPASKTSNKVGGGKRVRNISLQKGV